MTAPIPSDIEIAQNATLRPIEEIGNTLGIPTDSLEPYGRHKAKVSSEFARRLTDRKDGKLILVTAMTPTKAGEGKSTTTVGLGDALNRIGCQTAICLREPSLGPCFGMKGGAAGGGYAQVVPMEDINLHFTGDFHAITSAHNLLSAMIDNHIYWGNELGLDSRRVTWRRVVDLNDRALREITTSLGGVANGFPRETGFDITVASEIMAILCLATDLDDLQRRISAITVGYTRGKARILAAQLNAAGAMTALLKDALQPNLVQTLENNPAFVHGGPFANIAHGCNSLSATKTALKLADFVVTEAGFGADLGAEKFFDIKCRKGNLSPDAAVIVATARALKLHGGADPKRLNEENMDALRHGFANLRRHIGNIRKFGVPAVVGINRFSSDTTAELETIIQLCGQEDTDAYICSHWADGGQGAEDLAHAVAKLTTDKTSTFAPLYPDTMSLWDKARTIAREIYGADDIIGDKKIRDQFKAFQSEGFGHLPICMAKTQYSFSTDPFLKGAPTNHVVPIREVRLATGAEFLVIVCGEIMTMPGLPSKPAAEQISVTPEGQVSGLF